MVQRLPGDYGALIAVAREYHRFDFLIVVLDALHRLDRDSRTNFKERDVNDEIRKPPLILFHWNLTFEVR